MLLKLFSPDTYFFNNYAHSFAAVFLLFFLLGIYIICKNKKSPVNQAFFLMAMSIGLWLLGNALAYSSADPSVAIFYHRYLSNLGVVFISPSILFMAMAFLGIHKKYKRYLISAYLGIFLIYLTIFTRYFHIGVKKYFWGWQAYSEGIFSYVFILAVFVIAFFTFYLLARALKKEKDNNQRIRIKLLILSFAIGYLGGMDFLVDYGILAYPIGYIFETFSLAIMFYAVFRYRLMAENVDVAAKVILATIPDAVIVLNLDRRIEFMNKAAVDILGYQRGELLCKNLKSICSASCCRKLLTVKEKILMEGVFKGKGKKIIPFSISASKIKDDLGLHVGYVLVAKDMRTTNEMIRQLNNKKDALEKAKKDLSRKVAELKRINNIAIGREVKMIELKRKIIELEKKLNLK